MISLFAPLACAPAPEPVIRVQPVEVLTEEGPRTSPTSLPSEPPGSSSSPPPPAEPEPPELSELVLVELPAALEVRVTVSPGNSEVDRLTVDLDGTATSLGVPGDLASYDGAEAVFLLDRPTTGECVPAASHVVEVSVQDANGLSSGTVSGEIDTAPVGLVVPESGANDYGLQPSGTTFCGSLASVGNDGEWYTGDSDFFLFEVPDSRSWTLELRWTAVGDYDFYLYDGATGTPLFAGDGPELQGPEAVDVPLGAGRSYVVEVAGWSGDPGDWTFEIR